VSKSFAPWLTKAYAVAVMPRQGRHALETEGGLAQYRHSFSSPSRSPARTVTPAWMLKPGTGVDAVIRAQAR
jgi:hypothetical protein